MDYIQILCGNRLRLGEIKDIEGEVMYITLEKTLDLQVGQSICCSYNSLKFDSKILKKNDTSICIFFPINSKKIPNDRRKYPRIDVRWYGLINDFLSEKVFEQTATTEIEILDISYSGFGINSFTPLKKNIPYFLYINSNSLTLNPKVIINNEKTTDLGIRYGAEILTISNEDMHKLRRFILTQQLKR